MLNQNPFFFQSEKSGLSNIRLKSSRCPTKDVEADVQPLAYVGMDNTCESPCLSGHTIFIRPTMCILRISPAGLLVLSRCCEV